MGYTVARHDLGDLGALEHDEPVGQRFPHQQIYAANANANANPNANANANANADAIVPADHTDCGPSNAGSNASNARPRPIRAVGRIRAMGNTLCLCVAYCVYRAVPNTNHGPNSFPGRISGGIYGNARISRVSVVRR